MEADRNLFGVPLTHSVLHLALVQKVIMDALKEQQNETTTTSM